MPVIEASPTAREAGSGLAVEAEAAAGATTTKDMPVSRESRAGSLFAEDTPVNGWRSTAGD